VIAIHESAEELSALTADHFAALHAGEKAEGVSVVSLAKQ
jgi:hypothetical protein